MSLSSATVSSPPSAPARPSFIRRWHEFGRSPRLVGIDAARGLAIFGMIAAHVGVVWTIGGPDGIDLAAIAQGRSSILFALVAGISVALATGGRRAPHGEALRSARLRMVGRALAVLVLGLILELLGSGIAVILPIYGILFLILIPFLGLRRRTLALTAAALAVAGPTAVAGIRAVTLSGAGAQQGIGGSAVDFLVSGSYPLTVWLPLLLAGMAVGRLRLDELRTAAILLGGGIGVAAIGYGLGDAFNGTVREWFSGWGRASSGGSSMFPSSSLASGFSSSATADPRSYLERLGDVDPAALLAQAWGVAPHSGGSWEIIGSGGFALAVVGACLLIAHRLRVVLVPLAAVGSMPLTAYTAHVVSFAVLIAPLALAPGLASWDGDPAVSGLFWIGCVVALLLGCTVWALTRGRGPLESVTAAAGRRIDRPASPIDEAPVTGMSSIPSR